MAPDPDLIEGKMINPMTVLKDDQAGSEEKDLIAEPALHAEEHAAKGEASGTAIASSGEMYFENSTFWNRLSSLDPEIPGDPMSQDDKRASKRLTYEAPVTIENCDTGEYVYGRMYNYSLGGMYFETDYPLAPGAEIRVAIRKSTQGPGFDHFRAKVRWCQEISGAVVLFNYGVGVKYLSSFTQSKSNGKLRVIQGGAHDADD